MAKCTVAICSARINESFCIILAKKKGHQNPVTPLNVYSNLQQCFNVSLILVDLLTSLVLVDKYCSCLLFWEVFVNCLLFYVNMLVSHLRAMHITNWVLLVFFNVFVMFYKKTLWEVFCFSSPHLLPVLPCRFCFMPSNL